MKILGIDPGFTATGFAIIEKKDGTTRLNDYGYLKLKPADHLSVRIGIFYEYFQQKIEDFSISHISLETSFLGKNAQVFLKLGYLRGILYLLADQNKISLTENSPREIKAAITGSGAASKEQVAYVASRLFPVIKQTKNLRLDVTDAIAIAFCGLLSQSRDQLTKKQYSR